MRQTRHRWIRLFVVAAIVFASGLGGLLAHAGVTDHAGNDYKPSFALTESVSGLHVNDCADPGHIGGCAEVHCCASAVHEGSGRLTFALSIRDTYMEWGPSLHSGRLSNPLLRPPIATA